MRVQPLTDTRTLAKVAMGAVAVSCLVDVLHSILFARLISKAQNAGLWDLMDIVRLGETVDQVGWLSLIMTIVAAGLFIAWFFPAYRNLERLGKSLNHRPGWAIGAWFVPILNLYRPYEIYGEMADTYSLVAKKFPQHAPANTPVRSQLSTLAGVWWGLYLAGRILDNVAERVMNRTDDLPGMWVTWPNYLVAISGIAAILVIFRLNKLEQVSYRAYVSGDYQAYLDGLEAAKAEKLIKPDDGKSAEWYKTETENEKHLNRDEDPFN